MSKEELMRKIQELGFARHEAQLFLDTHPECKMALDYFHKLTSELEPLMAEYQSKYGPIVAEGALGDSWSWIMGPWPWQYENGKRNTEG